MATKFCLSAETTAAIDNLLTLLQEDAQTMREAYDERSERWQEGDVGNEVESWIEELDTLVDTLDNAPREPSL